MAESYLARITPLDGPDEGGPVDPGYGQKPPMHGGRPEPPIVLPPSPFPPGGGGSVELPIVLPPEVWDPTFPMPPIVITPPPDKPNPIPPGEIYPPLPPEVSGKLVAIIVAGQGTRQVHWYHVPGPSVPGTPQPKLPPR